MFPPNALMNDLLVSCLAKAQAHHPLRICDILIEATHVHMIAVVDDPNDVKGFMERFKTESAHAVNRLLGRKKRTVWCEGYDSPALLTPEDVVHKIAYTYENPSKDGLEERIENYPGVSGFRFRGKESGALEAPLVTRDDFGPLPAGKLSEEDYRELAKKLGYGKQRIQLRITPNAWMECFNIVNPQEYNERIMQEIRNREERHQAARKEAGRGVIGAQRLVGTPIGREFQPQRSGRRMWCICWDTELRSQFIRWAKNLVAQARAALERWRTGDRAVSYPPGLYPPGMPKTAELLRC